MDIGFFPAVTITSRLGSNPLTGGFLFRGEWLQIQEEYKGLLSIIHEEKDHFMVVGRSGWRDRYESIILALSTMSHRGGTRMSPAPLR
jgi:hypothetical protein